MDVYVQGKKVRLTQAEFKAQGGEGAVYVKGDTAYKVYADPAKMIPAAKIRELSVLTLPDIVRPREVLLDAGRAAVGYTMRSVPNGLALCRTFPRAFRERAGLTPDKALRLVQRLQEGVKHVHAQGLLLVDLSEMNFLVDSAFEHVFFIDVDSYQTGGFAATALTESVRDRHAAGFCQGTDWFSFAVVSFQIFVGIHPYKGKHPSLKTLDERMRGNVSVLDPAVSVPAACLPFDVIPQAYREWYQAVLERGRRVPPPEDAHALIVLPPQARPPAGSGQVTITQTLQCAGSIVSFTRGVAVSVEGIYLSGRRCAEAGAGTQVGLTPQGHAVRATLEAGKLRLFDLTDGCGIAVDAAGEQVMGADGRLYVKQGASLLEIGFLETPYKILPRLEPVGTVLENATQLFEGVALQSLLGAWYASLLPGPGRCHQVRLPEMDGFQVIDAKLQGGVLMVVAAGAGRFAKFIFRFDAAYALYDARTVLDLSTPGVNFTVLDSGVCLHLNDSECLEVFPACMGAAGLRVVSDPALGGNCLLLHDGARALFARGNALYQFAMR